MDLRTRLGIPATADPGSYMPGDMRVPAGEIADLGHGAAAYVSRAGLLCLQPNPSSFGCSHPSVQRPSVSTTPDGAGLVTGVVPAAAATVSITCSDGVARVAVPQAVDGLVGLKVYALPVPAIAGSGPATTPAEIQRRAEQVLRQSRATRAQAYDANGNTL
ncbi:hypothetical protein [Motilibacter deserti]|uniref:Uncharacterized protein n=1 Tax=Motilibacter deserti TaxID=2714956 RepID=A0ABX0GZU7_9ACTN|nr:hypothetical protein [Motilibacter deserti]NHC14733.1 hypothetical protein [Motilibacter deserti]